MISAITFVVAAMAVARITRLITIDVITAPLRLMVLKRSGDQGWWTFLVHCRYCASVWVGAAVAPLYWFYGRTPWFLIPAMALAFAEFIVLTAKLDEV